MSTDLVKINASDYGLEESKAKEIEALFTPMLAKMSELENDYNDILTPKRKQNLPRIKLNYLHLVRH